MKFVWLLTSVGLLAAVQPLLLGQGLADTSERALYPAGIGTRPDWEGKPQRPTFALLDDATTAGGRVALVAERMPAGTPDYLYADTEHQIKVATFVGRPGPLKAAQLTSMPSTAASIGPRWRGASASRT